ncbi:hypothetical protein IIM_05224 [Bacillus cereus VD107]|uniref:peptidase domain-containing ABC transporter n=1 Tax=Bacillus paramycoides TaxID=2026194 RepID=UPI00027A0E50|nr:hypothetical protein IIM_05224 [Bacillus cereus VD107]
MGLLDKGNKYKTKSRVPVIEQMNQYECGICSLNMILAYYKFEITISELRGYFGNGRDGVNLFHIKEVAEKFNMKCFGKKLPMSMLRNQKDHMPAIVFCNNNHFVVLEKIKNKSFFIVDPALGRIKMSAEEFETMYSGIVLFINPSENFEGRKMKKNYGIYELLLEHKSLFIYVFFLSLCLQGISIGIPIIIKNAIDNIIAESQQNMLMIFAIGFILVSILYVVFSVIKDLIVIKIQNKMDFTLMNRFVEHLMKLPYKFFEIRSKGDLILRAGSNVRIREFLSQKLISSVINVFLVIGLFVYMFVESPFMSICILSIGVLQIITILFTKMKLKNLTQIQVVDQTAMSSFMTEIMHGISTIKSLGIEDNIYNNWKKLMGKQILSTEKKAKFQLKIDTIINTLSFITPLLVVGIGISQVLEGNITIGTLFAFQVLASSFLAPLSALALLFNDLITLETLLDRINDVLNEKTDNNENCREVNKLEGEIKLKNVSFRYTDYSHDVLNNISLYIKKGQKVSIVGKSGSGKSTLASLLAGLYTPTEGHIFFDGINYAEIYKPILRKKIGVVLQENFLFHKTILENLTMHLESASSEDVILATKMAEIHEDIIGMPMGYQTIISENGSNVSGGQKQRLALARALVSRPSILLLDEATSALDTVTEQNIERSIQKLECTRIVIAHRLSTVMNSDLIIVMESGRIIDTGTHNQLMQKCIVYKELYYNGLNNEYREVVDK